MTGAGTLAELIAAQARRTPDSLAVRYGRERLTYAELADRVNRLARVLLARGVGPETVVAVAVPRSIDLVVALCAVHQAGGAYLPIDVDLPAARVDYQLDDAAPTAVVTTSEVLGILPERTRPTRIVLDGPAVARELRGASGAEVTESERGALGPANAAYVMYTSGSTGRPKGVVVPHEGIVNRLLWTQAEYPLDGADRVLQKTPVGFDVSVWEFFWPLATGAAICVARPGGHRDPQYLADVIREQGVTVVHFVPSMLGVFLDEPAAAECTGLRRVICSGEALSADLRDRCHRTLPARLANLYGPTEASVDVTYWNCSLADEGDRVVPIGHPVRNTRVHLLDDELDPVEAGATGELFIAGVQLARGYLGRPGLTAERFLPDPFGPPGSRLYRTGDLARRRQDGAIEFAGRVDDQIKIRGMRVEPGEVEAVLAEHPGVGRVAVTARRDGGALVAHVVPDRATAGPVGNLLRLGDDPGVPLQCVGADMVMFGRGKAEADFLYEEVFERREYLRGGVVLPDDAVVFDVGAHAGYFSVLVGREHPDATVYAFEPIPDLFEVLRLNTALHGVRARLFDHGLAARSGVDTFTYYPHLSVMSGRFAQDDVDQAVVEAYLRNEPAAASLSEADMRELVTARMHGERLTCRLRTLSEVIDEEQVDRVDLLKIDAEKSELEILQGVAPRHWQRIRQVVVEVHDLDGQAAEVVGLLRHHGFDVRTDVSSVLAGTGLVNVIARRPGTTAAAGSRTAGSRWYDPRRLTRDVLDHAARLLPAHMVPADVVLHAELPVTASGKLDHRSLSASDAGRATSGARDRAPRTVTEAALCELFATAVGRASVSVDDHLFRIGGHSLLAAKLLPRIRVALGGAITVTEMLARPTVSSLAGRRGGSGAYEPVLPLRLSGSGPPLWCVPAASGLGWVYAAFLPRLPADRPVYALQTVAGLADHLTRMFAAQPEGPYHLLGWADESAAVDALAAAVRATGAECVVLDPLEPCGQADPDVVAELLHGAAASSAVAAALAGETVRAGAKAHPTKLEAPAV
ncbi:amino acid adenylation domain-containing protein [Amycolatopsis mediterranei]